MIQEVFKIDDIGALGKFLSGVPDVEALRDSLYGEFIRYSRYRNVEEWNRAVRICECLAIIGWGTREPLEAVRGVYFNGNPDTCFVNRDKKPRFLDAVWSKRNGGLAIDFGRSMFHAGPGIRSVNVTDSEESIGEIQAGKLNSQRNWIPKNPICVTRGIANCYEGSKAVIDSISADLMPELNRRMRPELYGTAVNQIVLDLAFSFYDNYHCKTNYIIADPSLKLKRSDLYPALLGMFSEKEIEDNGYYLRNRFTYGPFRADSGTARIAIVFEKEFSELPQARQKQILGDYLLHAVSECARRLRGKVDYDFGLMTADFAAILRKWCDQ